MENRNPALLELDRACVIRDGQVVLHEVSLRIASGQHTAIIGPNGCGKSTLVKLVNRELHPLARPQSPPIRVLGDCLWNVASLRRQLGVVSADLHADLQSLRHLDAEDAVLSAFHASFGLPLDVCPTARDYAEAHRALDAMGVLALARRPLHTLSTGQMRRVLIARALVHRPRALLLDEPTTGLDIGARLRLLERLRGLAQAGITLVLVTHHIEEVLPEMAQVVLMKDGRISACGRPHEMLDSARMSALFGTPLRVEHDGVAWQLHPEPARSCVPVGDSDH